MAKRVGWVMGQKHIILCAEKNRSDGADLKTHFFVIPFITFINNNVLDVIT